MEGDPPVRRDLGGFSGVVADIVDAWISTYPDYTVMGFDDPMGQR
jgi:hypothetical protein